jgi:hypothetical protein
VRHKRHTAALRVCHARHTLAGAFFVEALASEGPPRRGRDHLYGVHVVIRSGGFATPAEYLGNNAQGAPGNSADCCRQRVPDIIGIVDTGAVSSAGTILLVEDEPSILGLIGRSSYTIKPERKAGGASDSNDQDLAPLYDEAIRDSRSCRTPSP